MSYLLLLALTLPGMALSGSSAAQQQLTHLRRSLHHNQEPQQERVLLLRSSATTPTELSSMTPILRAVHPHRHLEDQKHQQGCCNGTTDGDANQDSMEKETKDGDGNEGPTVEKRLLALPCRKG